MKKVFILTQFGSPHEWTHQYIESVQKLEKYGWYWKIFTNNKDIQSKGNVDIIPMEISQFNDLVIKTCGVNPKNFITDRGVPSNPMSDFYIGNGVIFANYLNDADYWGITNWDVVYGRLDHFISDGELSKYDIWSDDVNAINGVFSLYKNTEYINKLFMEIPIWKVAFENHHLYGLDERDMTTLVRKVSTNGRIAFGYPKYHPLHSYDRLEQHVPDIKLQLTDEGSLFELYYDMARPTNDPLFTTGLRGREIMYFHFSKTKTWPKLQ